MVLRPTSRAIGAAGLRAALPAVPALLLAYIAVSSGVVVPALFGALLIALGGLILGNVIAMSIRLNEATLKARSLLVKREVNRSAITRIVPIEVSYRRTPFMPWRRSARMFDVCTIDGPTGIWLNPNIYGDEPVRQMIEAIGITPDSTVEKRELEVFSLNRDYGRR